MPNPNVSVIMPTYNRPERLKLAVESILSQNEDTPFELIVVDDGSDNESQMEYLSKLERDYSKVKVNRQRNSGPATARNYGWRSSNGEIILFTDDDCLVSPNWVTDLVDAFEPGIGAVGGPFVPHESHLHSSMFAKYHRWQAEDMYRPIEQSRTQKDPLPHGITANIGYRRSVLEEVGGFDESFPVAGGEDADLIRRVSSIGYSFKYVPVPVYHNDLYTLETFIKRSYNRGKGLHHLHIRHGPQRNIPRVIFGLLVSPLFLPLEITRQRGLSMAGISVLDRIMNRFGELSAAVFE